MSATLNNSDNIARMHLNSKNHNDKNFDNSIKFIVEKYINNDIPEQIQCDNLHIAVYEAYKLFLSNELHSIGITDHNNNYNGTDALNYFTDNVYTNNQTRIIDELEKELNIYKDFIKLTRIEKTFNDYKERCNF